MTGVLKQEVDIKAKVMIEALNSSKTLSDSIVSGTSSIQSSLNSGRSSLNDLQTSLDDTVSSVESGADTVIL